MEESKKEKTTKLSTPSTIYEHLFCVYFDHFRVHGRYKKRYLNTSCRKGFE